MSAYDPITGDPILHLGPRNDVSYDEARDEWVSHRSPDARCRYPMGHRDKHACSCTCALSSGHKGRHACEVTDA